LFLFDSEVIATVGSGEIRDCWIRGQVNMGLLMKRKQGLRSPPSDPIGERDQWTRGIAGNQVAWEIIPQGGPAIQATVSPRGYVSALGEFGVKSGLLQTANACPYKLKVM
jgi:hypothetical protein